jgi:hypothetical protein
MQGLFAAPLRISSLFAHMCQNRGVTKLSAEYLEMLTQIRTQAAAVEKPTLLNSTSDSGGRHESGTVVGQPRKRLLFAFSFWLPKWQQVAANLAEWHTHGEPCTGDAAPFMSLVMAPTFESNTSVAILASVKLLLHPALAAVRRCFNTIEWHTKANFTWPDSQYPQAPTKQFFQLIFHPSFRSRFDVLWLMEQDIHPLRPTFLDALYREALLPTFFWLKGTLNQGRPPYEKSPTESLLSNPSWVQLNKGWLYHINGAALYGLNFPLFDEVLRAARLLSTLNPHFPWDVTLELVLKDVRNDCLTSRYSSVLCMAHGESVPSLVTFAIVKLISTRVHYTDFVWNVGSQVANPEVLDAARAAGVYLLHGTASRLSMRNERRTSKRMNE